MHLAGRPRPDRREAGGHEGGDPGAAAGSIFDEFMSVALPEWALVHQSIEATEVEDVREAVNVALRGPMAAVAPATRVCLAVGSRGIDRLDEVVAAVVAEIRRAGGEVFVVPAMGSHGGATAEGQLETLASYGVTPDRVGCEIRSSMETVELGLLQPDLPVFVDRIAYEQADAIVPINRIKPHTDFTGSIESGIAKMIAIGLGKQRGADTLHRRGFAAFHELIPMVAQFTIGRLSIPFGLALLENGYARLMRVEAVPGPRILKREPELLRIASQAMGRIPVGAIDTLVLDYIGKDVSGLGMDSNVVGRYYTGFTGEPPAIQRIVVRDLTDATEGNAVGIGLADVVLRRAVDRMDLRKTYVNCITAKTPEGARVALTVNSDREALAVALGCCTRVAPGGAGIVRACDTKHLDRLYVSAGLLPEMLASGADVVEPAHPIHFDSAGMFIDPSP
jgi:hypothetical protein